MLIKIDGIVELPEGMTEDYFNRAFLEFMESYELEFGGGTKVVIDEEEESVGTDETTLKLLRQYQEIDKFGDLQKSSLVTINILYKSLSKNGKKVIKQEWPGILSIVEVIHYD